jgi:hypothetical protein
MGESAEEPSPHTTVEQHVSGYGNIFTGTGDIHVTQQAAPVDLDDRRNLDALNDDVRRQWVDGYLKDSLHGMVMLELQHDERPEFVESRWARVVALPGRVPVELPSTTDVTMIFETHGRNLLILGEPGAGKTTTLLELCSKLQAHRKAQTGSAVPVILNLSTWAVRRKPLTAWIIDELHLRYRVSRRIGENWLEKGRLLLLLDGLDEVADSSRAACVRAIKDYDEPLPGIAVCCRLQEYIALEERVNFDAAICLRPFSSEQVASYLASFTPRLDGLRTAIAADGDIRELSTNPLMLSVMTMAFVDHEVSTIGGSADSLRATIFEAYISRMFERRISEKLPYPKEKVERWLHNVARIMATESTSILLIEQLQPTLLPERWMVWIYASITRTGFAAILVAWMLTLSGSLQPDVIGLSFWIGALMVLPSITLAGVRLERWGRSSWLGFPALLGTVILSILLPFLHIFGGVFHPFRVHMPFFHAVAGMLGFAAFLTAAYYVGCPPPQFGPISIDIRSAERIVWSRALLRGALRGSLLWAIVMFFLAIGLENISIEHPFKAPTWTEMLRSGVQYGATGLVMGGIGGALVAGRRSRVPSETSQPNEGMRVSLLHGSIAACLCLAYSIGLSFWLNHKHSRDVESLAKFVDVFLLVSVFLSGGTAVTRHYCLRILVAISKLLPLGMTQFLEQARKLIFLRRVGGGYLFIHRCLLDHFAARAPTSCYRQIPAVALKNPIKVRRTGLCTAISVKHCNERKTASGF